MKQGGKSTAHELPGLDYFILILATLCLLGLFKPEMTTMSSN